MIVQKGDLVCLINTWGFDTSKIGIVLKTTLTERVVRGELLSHFSAEVFWQASKRKGIIQSHNLVLIKKTDTETVYFRVGTQGRPISIIKRVRDEAW